MALIVLLCLPQLPVWIEMVSGYGFGEGEAIGTGVVMLPPGWLLDWLAAFGAGQGWRLWLYVMSFLAGLLVLALRFRRGWRLLLLTVLWLGLPLAVLLLLQPSKSLSYRHLIFLLPMYLLVVAYGVVSMVRMAHRWARYRLLLPDWRTGRWRAIGFAAVALPLVVFAGASSAPVQAYFEQEKQNWRAAARLISQSWQSGDALAASTPYRAQCVAYYAPELPAANVPSSVTDFVSLTESYPRTWWVRTRSPSELYDRQINTWLQEQGIEPVVFWGTWSPVAVYLFEGQDAPEGARLALLEMASDLAPQDAALRASLGDAYRGRAMWELAVEQYRVALRIEPKLAAAHVGLGLVAQERGRPAEALESFEAATRADPQLGQAFRLLGDAYRDAGRPNEASLAYEHALEASPAFEHKAWFFLRLGQAYLESDQPEKAKQAFERALDLEPDNTTAQQYLDRITQ
jgi:superkiller protein 3